MEKKSRKEKRLERKANFIQLKKDLGANTVGILASNRDEVSSSVGLGKVPQADASEFWEEVFSDIEMGETLQGLARKHKMSEASLRYRLRTGDLHERFLQAHEGRAVYHAQSIEGMLDRLESGEIESDVARVSIDARKWLATKYYPRMFGERHELNVKTTDMTKVYIEQLKMIMSRQETRLRDITPKVEE